MRLLSLSLLLAVTLVAATAIPASAHADPVLVTPAACAEVDSISEVRIEFSEELNINASSLNVLVDGELVASTGPDLNDLDRVTMVAAVPAGISGVVEVEWTSTSVLDDDAVSGRYAFAVGGTTEGVDCGASEPEASGSSMSTMVILGLSAMVLVGLVGVARRPSRVEA